MNFDRVRSVPGFGVRALPQFSSALPSSDLQPIGQYSIDLP